MANYRTTRPIWSKFGNLIPALRKVTQKDVSASMQELLNSGYVEEFTPEKKEPEKKEVKKAVEKKPTAKK